MAQLESAARTSLNARTAPGNSNEWSNVTPLENVSRAAGTHDVSKGAIPTLGEVWLWARAVRVNEDRQTASVRDMRSPSSGRRSEETTFRQTGQAQGSGAG